MNRKAYWRQQLPLLCLHVVCMAVLAVFLFLCGNSVDSVLLIMAVWIAVLTAYLCKAYYNRKTYLEKLLELTRQLEERYLISEVMEKPVRADDQVYHQILKMADKSCWNRSLPSNGSAPGTRSTLNSGFMKSRHRLQP